MPSVNNNSAMVVDVRPKATHLPLQQQKSSKEQAQNSVKNQDSFHSNHSQLSTPNTMVTQAEQQQNTLVEGIQLTGLLPKDLTKAELKLSMDLQKGHYTFPGTTAKSIVKIGRNSNASLNILIERDQENNLVIKKAKLEFNPHVKLMNPGSALFAKESKYPIKTIDSITSVSVSSIDIENGKKPSVNGIITVLGAWRLDLSSTIPQDKLPQMHLSLSQLQQKSSNLNFDTKSIIKQLGKLSKTAFYSLNAETKAKELSLNHELVKVTTKKDKTTLSTYGTIDLEPDSSIHIIIDQGSTNIKAPIGHRKIKGSLLVENTMSDNRSIIGSASLHVDNLSMQGQFNDNVKNDLNLNLKNGKIGADLSFSHNSQDGLKINDKSNLSFDINPQFKPISAYSHDDVQTKISHLSMKARGESHIGFANNTFSLMNGKISSTVKFSDPKISQNKFSASISGQMNANAQVDQLNYTSTDKFPQMSGNLSLLLKPSKNLLKDFPALSNLLFKAKFSSYSDGKIALNPYKTSFPNFLSSISHLTGYPRRVVDLNSTPVGRIGSSEMNSYMSKLTGAAITDNNQVELLHDGINSYPKRLEIINSAQKSICMQSLVFKNDESGQTIASALIAASQRGVKVRLIIDSLGNLEGIKELFEENEIYKKLRNGGVELYLYNEMAERGIRTIFSVLKNNSSIANIENIDKIKTPAQVIKLLHRVLLAASGKLASVDESQKQKLEQGLNDIFSRVPSSSSKVIIDELVRIVNDNNISLSEVLAIIQQLVELNYHWHEKYLVVDNNKAILGGMNIADEYMFGGTDRTANSFGVQRPCWRDIDIYVEGAAGFETFNNFSRNWAFLTGENISADCSEVERKTPSVDGKKVQIIQHRARFDGDHNITNFMIENLKALNPGEKAYIENAYFLPVGVLSFVKQAMIDAAQRGADIRLLTNGIETTDAPQVNQGAIFAYRELLQAGVRLFERTGRRTIHSKAATFASKAAVVGSWNMENRATSLNSEVVAVVYDDQFTNQLEQVIENGMVADVAKELTLQDVESQEITDEALSSAFNFVGHLI